MPRSSPMTMTLPPFAGMTRRLIFANLGVYFVLAILGLLVPRLAGSITAALMLAPWSVVHGQVWQVVTYSFVHNGVLDILFAMLTLWFCGAILEGAFGARWLGELYFTSVVGGAVLASAIAFTGLFHMSPLAFAAGAWGGVFGLMIALAMRFGDQEFLLWFTVRIRAKYMVAIYILIAVALLLRESNTFSALLQLSGALFGFLYVRFAPRRGMAFGFTEQFYGVRNAWYRSKRRRAAKKFEVYMNKQGRQVRFDEEGRYLDPDESKRDPNDRRWMN